VSHYVIRVEGRLSAGLVGAFASLDAVQDTHTVLHGAFADQTTLIGVLNRLRTLGLDVVEIHQLPERAAAPAARGRRGELSG